MTPKFFKTSSEFRAWLAKNHDKQAELIVGFYKVKSGRKSITYQEALDQALCFGWIDGIVRRIDEESHCQRFTPRRKGSNWSAINVKRAKELEKAGLMHPAGRAAFAKRTKVDANRYSYETGPRELGPQYAKTFRSKKRAWEFFDAQAPSYKRMISWWVMSAKKEETRLRRLKTLMEASAKGEKV